MFVIRYVKKQLDNWKTWKIIIKMPISPRGNFVLPIKTEYPARAPCTHKIYLSCLKILTKLVFIPSRLWIWNVDLLCLFPEYFEFERQKQMRYFYDNQVEEIPLNNLAMKFKGVRSNPPHWIEIKNARIE